MKKLLFLAAVAVFGMSTMNAQTDKGTWLFGASAGLSFSSSTTTPEFDGEEVDGDTTLSNFSITPSANYFVIDNLAVGLNLSFSSSKTKVDFDGNESEVKNSTFSVIPSAIYFFGESSTKPYLTAGAGLISSGGEEDTTKFSGLAINAGGGVAIFLNDNVAVNLGVTYLRSSLSNKENSDFKNKSNTFGLGAGFNIFI